MIVHVRHLLGDLGHGQVRELGATRQLKGCHQDLQIEAVVLKGNTQLFDYALGGSLLRFAHVCVAQHGVREREDFVLECGAFDEVKGLFGYPVAQNVEDSHAGRCADQQLV